MIKSFRNRSLQRFWENSDVERIPTDWAESVEEILDLLDKAKQPEDMALPGLGFYAFAERTKPRFAIVVSRAWRIAFSWKGGDAIEVDLEEVH